MLAVSFTSVACMRGGSDPSVNDEGRGAPSYSSSVNLPTPSDWAEAKETNTDPESVSPSVVVTLMSGTVGMPASASVNPSFEPAPSESVGSVSVVVVAWLTTEKAAPAETAPPATALKGIEPSVPEDTVNEPCMPLTPVKSRVPGPALASGPLPDTPPESESTASASVTSTVPPPAARVTAPARVADAPS